MYLLLEMDKCLTEWIHAITAVNFRAIVKSWRILGEILAKTEKVEQKNCCLSRVYSEWVDEWQKKMRVVLSEMQWPGVKFDIHAKVNLFAVFIMAKLL